MKNDNRIREEWTSELYFTDSGIIIKALLCFAVFIAIFFAIGIVLVVYDYYRCQRVPIYQTVMTDFDVVQQEEENDDFRPKRRRDIRKITDAFDIKTLQCFIFQTHNLRPFYRIYMVGELPENTDFSEYRLEKHPLKNAKSLFHTLKLCEANPLESEDYLESKDYFMVCVYIYCNRIILSTGSANQTFLMNDADKQAYLEQFIATRKK